MNKLLEAVPTIIIGDEIQLSPRTKGIVESRMAEFKRRFRGDLEIARMLDKETENLTREERAKKIRTFAVQHNMPVAKVYRLLDAVRIDDFDSRVRVISLKSALGTNNKERVKLRRALLNLAKDGK